MKIKAVSPPAAMAVMERTAAERVAISDAATSEDTYSARLEKAVEKLNSDAEAKNRQVRFALHKETNRIMIEVVDSATKQIVATFPPKQILDMVAAFEQDAEKTAQKAIREVK